MIVYTLKAKDEDIDKIALLFPRYKYLKYLPSFMPEKYISFKLERPRDVYPESKCIIISDRDYNYNISDNESLGKLFSDVFRFDKEIIEYVFKQEHPISEAIKLRYIKDKKTYIKNAEIDESIFTLFDSLNQPFNEVYKIYRKIELPIQVIFPSLITMFSKVSDERQLVSFGYKRALKKNKVRLNRFKIAALKIAVKGVKKFRFEDMLYAISR